MIIRHFIEGATSFNSNSVTHHACASLSKFLIPSGPVGTPSDGLVEVTGSSIRFQNPQDTGPHALRSHLLYGSHHKRPPYPMPPVLRQYIDGVDLGGAPGIKILVAAWPHRKDAHEMFIQDCNEGLESGRSRTAQRFPPKALRLLQSKAIQIVLWHMTLVSCLPGLEENIGNGMSVLFSGFADGRKWFQSDSPPLNLSFDAVSDISINLSQLEFSDVGTRNVHGLEPQT